MEVNNDNLEKALSNNASEALAEEAAPQMPREMEIGFHQGALRTLTIERAELFKMIQNVESVMGAHIQRLEQLGVKVQTKKE